MFLTVGNILSVVNKLEVFKYLASKNNRSILTRLSVATILLITIKRYNQLKVRIAEE